ncbi:twin-arginine translocase TatA/TatE family subunit [Paenibacillus hamazuiensis]|uniref:twin-arginine translocase TatA/TatE family subunit n=1 Tax=Paenibacillus hamazuiensis TaxID=2936508 RepID=UPI00200EF777|nr:twin-arginine translocase TatA/TatE family subunit [Paenibacillus hamazuiensis]
MFGNLGFGEILLIGLVALLLFGPQKLPELGRSLGRTIREFKKSAQEIMSDEPAERKVEPPVQTAAPVKPEEKPSSDNRRLPD